MNAFLVATDLSARSDRAIARAGRLAAETDTPLTVIHVVDEDLPEWIVESQVQLAEKAVKGYLATLDVTADVRIVVGDPEQAILEAAAALEASLVILGTHRDRPVEDFFLGSTAERVLRYCPYPVLLVRQYAHIDYRDVAIAMDFSVPSQLAAEVAFSTLPPAHFHVIHAFQVPFAGFQFSKATEEATRNDHKARLEQILKSELKGSLARCTANGGTLSKHFIKGQALAAITRELRRIDAQLLVMGTNGRSGIAHAIIGSVAEGFLREGQTDVLVVHGR